MTVGHSEFLTDALLTDLYELTMAASYHAHGMNGPATFDLFVRGLPRDRHFLVAAGLDPALDYLERFRFDADAIAYLRSLRLFDEAFLAYLGTVRFTGEVWALPEGEVFFPPEPVLRVTAPLIEAQLVETYLLATINFQSMVASKAARVALACGGRPFVDFSARRDHGPEAALGAARAAFVGGAASTSNVLAGRCFGIPVAGTMAHSYVQAFAEEEAAFRAFARDFPDRSTLLIDTNDTERGARRAADVALELAASGIQMSGVRIDSGDLGTLARTVRSILDAAGLRDMRILLSGDLDERRIASLMDADVPADSFGVGTQLGTSADAPYLGGVYKLVEDSGGPKMKTSTGKVTLPGRKQVHRVETAGEADHDVIALEDERVLEGRPLLHRVMIGGRRIGAREPLTEARERARYRIAQRPASLRSLERPATPFPVRISPRLRVLQAELRAQLEVARA